MQEKGWINKEKFISNSLFYNHDVFYVEGIGVVAAKWTDVEHKLMQYSLVDWCDGFLVLRWNGYTCFILLAFFSRVFLEYK